MNMRPVQAFVLPTALAAALAAIAGIGFAIWMENGAALFLSLVQSGIAWCF